MSGKGGMIMGHIYITQKDGNGGFFFHLLFHLLGSLCGWGDKEE
jgi:hypothetical protein